MPSQELVCVTALSEETPTTQISDAQFGLRSQRHDQSSFKLTSFSTVDLSTAQQMLNNTSCLFLESKLDNIALKLSPRGNSYKPKGTAQLLNPTSQNGHLKFHAATRMLLKWTKMKFKLKKKRCSHFLNFQLQVSISQNAQNAPQHQNLDKGDTAGRERHFTSSLFDLWSTNPFFHCPSAPSFGLRMLNSTFARSLLWMAFHSSRVISLGPSSFTSSTSFSLQGIHGDCGHN